MQFLNAVVNFTAVGFLILGGSGLYNLIIDRGSPTEAAQYVAVGAFGFMFMVVCSAALSMIKVKG